MHPGQDVHQAAAKKDAGSRATKQPPEGGSGMDKTAQDDQVARDANVGDKDGNMEYKLGDSVKTINGLVACVVAVNLQSGTYDIKYRTDGDVDQNVFPKYLKPYIPLPRRKRTSETKNWEYREEPVETMDAFISRTDVSSEFKVLPSDAKRRRPCRR